MFIDALIIIAIVVLCYFGIKEVIKFLNKMMK